jgi:steroid delta-isomerase-like uncharacterized protein
MNRATVTALLKRCFEAFNANDHAVLLTCLSDDVALDINQGAREFGKERFRWFMALRARHFKDQVSDIVIMTDESGGRAAVEFTLRGRYLVTAEPLPRASGQGYSLPVGLFLEIDDGLITRVSAHFSMAELTAQLSRG